MVSNIMLAAEEAGFELHSRRFTSYRTARRFAIKIAGDWDIKRVDDSAYEVHWAETTEGEAFTSDPRAYTFTGYF